LNYLLENGEFKMKSGKIFKRGPLVSEVEVVPGHYRRRYKRVLDLEAMKGSKKKQASDLSSAENQPDEPVVKKVPAKKVPAKKAAAKKTPVKKKSASKSKE
jgi:hypothetical protein